MKVRTISRLGFESALLVSLVAWTGPTSSEVLYVTQTSIKTISTADTVTNAVNPVFMTVGTPDSLMFDTQGNIIYTNLGSGEVRSYDLTSQSDTVIASGLIDPADVALEPSGTSMLVSDYGGGEIYRINLTNNARTTLGNYGGNPQGLAYDGAGHLFAVLGTRSGAATSFVARLDPTTGAILGQTAHEVNLDGLTYDAFSGKLYSGSGPSPGNGIYQIDPGNLAITLLPNSTGVPFDGITTDSAGNLYIASAAQIYQYNLVSHALTPKTPVSYLDDLAPLTGLGAPTGYIEICKASDPNHPVSGTFDFTLTNGGFSDGPISVPVGECSGPIAVPSGAVTVTEAPVPGIAVSSVTAYAYDALGFLHNELVSWTMPNLSAVVHVSPGDVDEETLATFTNYEAPPGQLKLCKIAGDKTTLGQLFSFTVTSGTQQNGYSVVAGPASQGGNCVLAGTFPVNSQVTISETPQPPYVPTGITVNEGQLTACQPPSIYCAVATTIPGFTEVTYTNRNRGIFHKK